MLDGHRGHEMKVAVVFTAVGWRSCGDSPIDLGLEHY
jgi:hypothetical protein